MAFKRRSTTQTQIFERGGAQAVAYDLSQPHRVTITVPYGSSWTSGPHWHETHDEYLQILQGRALVRLADGIQEYGVEDGILEVPKYTVHEWRRAPENQSPQALIVREWTSPEDGKKEGFFRMLNSFLTEPQPGSLYQAPLPIPGLVQGWMTDLIVTLQIFIIFRSWDNWPVLVGNDSGWISWFVTHLTFKVSSLLGFVLGLRGAYVEYVGEKTISQSRQAKMGDDKIT